MSLVNYVVRQPSKANAWPSLRHFISLALLLSPFAFASHGAHAQPQQQPARPAQTTNEIRLAKIEFVGLERYKSEEAVAASGLQVGQTVDEITLDAAAERLMGSGLFKNLSFSFRASKGLGTVVFKVAETSARAAVVFDNFIWFADEELQERVRKVVPGFDGAAPEGGAMTDAIKKALTDLLREKNITGYVEYMPSADPSGRNFEHVFTARGANVRVCELKYPGARAVTEQTLVENSSGIFNNEYSRMFVQGYADANLSALYRERGHLRAAFRAPRAVPLTNDECQGGVSLSIPVDEGIAYVWEGAEWTGNTDLTAQELDRALGMKQKEPANGLKIDKGLETLARAYARKGYLMARAIQRPVFDDEGRSVRVRFEVNEGPQYRMGQLTITGLPEQDANNLQGRWRILSREPYDAEYIKEFLRKEATDVLTRAAMEKRVPANLASDTDVRLDHDKKMVDVTVSFKEKKT